MPSARRAFFIMSKTRIKLDALTILAAALFLAGLVFLYPQIYLQNKFISEVMDFVGFFTMVLGVLFRAAGRGYKKAFAGNGTKLATSGPYAVIRNPMYLGTFLIGAGLVLLAFPLWTVVPFAVVFFLRFRLEIQKEETHLSQMFGKEYAVYCQKTPRLFPTWKSMTSERLQAVFPWRYCRLTQELKSLLYLPIIAIALEILEETAVWDQRHFTEEGIIFLLNLIITAALFWILIRRPEDSSGENNGGHHVIHGKI